MAGVKSMRVQANPSATVQIGRLHVPVRAREAEGAERETLWDRVVAIAPDYDEYKRRTSRRIPVVVLDRAR